MPGAVVDGPAMAFGEVRRSEPVPEPVPKLCGGRGTEARGASVAAEPPARVRLGSEAD